MPAHPNRKNARSTPARPGATNASIQLDASQATPRHAAVVGAGIAGLACARTLAQAGWRVSLFEREAQVGGRMATQDSAHGSFDSGAQYFTVRDPRFELALNATGAPRKRWSANTVRVLDAAGRVAAVGLPPKDAHWVSTPGMNALPALWAQALGQPHRIELQTHITQLERDAVNPQQWQLRADGPQAARQVFGGFDAVILAQPSSSALGLLQNCEHAPAAMQVALQTVRMAPCWTLMLAYPQAMQPGMSSLGPQWNAARSTHHRIAWLARESSKPARTPVERWTVQASAAWSQEHLHDDATRVQAKLLKAFAEITGIRATPSHAQTQRWAQAQTQTPLGQSHLWDAASGIGVCGDWCLGHRVEDAFVSGLELALAVA